jgi:hypothetical protein
MKVYSLTAATISEMRPTLVSITRASSSAEVAASSQKITSGKVSAGIRVRSDSKSSSVTEASMSAGPR